MRFTDSHKDWHLDKLASSPLLLRPKWIYYILRHETFARSRPSCRCIAVAVGGRQGRIALAKRERRHRRHCLDRKRPQPHCGGDDSSCGSLSLLQPGWNNLVLWYVHDIWRASSVIDCNGVDPRPILTLPSHNERPVPYAQEAA